MTTTATLSSVDCTLCQDSSGEPTARPGGEPRGHYASPAERIRETATFGAGDIELLADTFRAHGSAPGTPWDNFRHSFLALPDWFQPGLDPLSAQYAQQQRRLWALIAGVDDPYDPHLHEETIALAKVDAVRLPAYFARRDPGAVANAAEHVLATGMILKNSGVKPGQWALEYGAGFAQTALHLARLGVNVDTVDISPEFCRTVKAQADFYRVPLTPFNGRFGWNPRGDRKYDLIWFYESFHHCLDFRSVVYDLKRHLAPEGRILLAGEPIVRRENRAVPYPWGLRLHSQVVAVVRIRHWFELGFSEDFLVSLFTNAGFTAKRIECPVSMWGEGYLLRHRGKRIDLQEHWLPEMESRGWHKAESGGRWTKGQSTIALDMTDSFTEIEVEAVNHHSQRLVVDFQYGGASVNGEFGAGERRRVRIDASTKAPRLVITSPTLIPARASGRPGPRDTRALGIFVTSVSYR